MHIDEFKALGIELIKMPYTVDGDMRYYDLGESTNLTAFYQQMREGAVVKTQALNEHDYCEYFEPVLKNGEDVLYISFTHNMSNTFNSMNMAIKTLKEKYPNRTITCMDSGEISIGGGVVVRRVVKAYNEGLLFSDIPKFIDQLRHKIKIYVTVEDLEYLRRGGRISRVKSIVGSVLGVKPIIEMDGVKGALEKIGSAKGRKVALKQVVSYLEESDIEEGSEVIILHADCLDDANMIKEKLEPNYKNIKFHDVGPVVGAHCGPGTVGVCFIVK